MLLIPDVNVYAKTRNHRKPLRKTQKHNNLLKTKSTKYRNINWVGGEFLRLQ